MCFSIRSCARADRSSSFTGKLERRTRLRRCCEPTGARTCTCLLGSNPSRSSSSMRFVKMHGAGNDYVLVASSDLPKGVDRIRLARSISDRRRGVGSDGLIIVEPSDRAAARMEMYNADGSRSQMCGNGVRLVAEYLSDRQRK